MYETKNIDDVYSVNNIVENKDQTTNHKLNSLKTDIETILSMDLKKHAIQNDIPSTRNTNNMNDMRNTDKYSNFKRSNDYTINDLKKDLEDLLITELRKHGVV
jgi:hypothetical protein